MIYLKYNNVIPKQYTEDLLNLSAYIMKELDIYIPCQELYHIWRSISMELNVLWLDINSTPNNMPRNLFLKLYLSKYSMPLNQ